jgi:hypothetical protein
MEQIPMAEWERTMKVQEVILRAMAKKITWWQAAEIVWHQRTIDETVGIQLPLLRTPFCLESWELTVPYRCLASR